MYTRHSPGIFISLQNRAGDRAGAMNMSAASDSFYKIEKALIINLEGLLGESETTIKLVELHIL